MLFTPERHEPVGGHEFDEEAARRAIARIAERAEAEMVDGLWPLDEEERLREDESPGRGVHYGAAGIAWALGELGRPVDRRALEQLETRMLAERDAAELQLGGVWGGVPGVLAVAEHFWPDAARRGRIAEYGWASLERSTFEVMFGHPGHMALAAQLHRRTGEERWKELWSAGADLLLEHWQHDAELDVWAWTQHLGYETRYVGAAHGLVGNVHVLRHGPLSRDDVDDRAVATLSRLAVVDGGHANWPPSVGGPLVANERIRVQWCHGAPGVLLTMWDAGPADEAWNELLLSAGRLVWDAGPLRDAPSICHGTAGSAYALLALWQRTGDERWLERARALAQHAAAQVEERFVGRGHARHGLFTGDEGVALCLAACCSGDARLPVADYLI